MERNVVIESFSVSEHIAGIVNGFSSDLLTHSPSKSFVNRCETRLRLLLLFLVCSLFNFVSLKAHQGLIAGTYTAEFDYDVVGTLAAARYNETDILYKLPDRIGNIYPDRFAKEARYERGGRRKEDKEWTYHFDGEGFLAERISKRESVERYDWIRRKRIIEPLTWSYTWDGAGQLIGVKNNDKVNLRFEYDALGRRTAKINAYGKAEQHTITRFLWDGNVPLHEWSYPLSDRPETIDDSYGQMESKWFANSYDDAVAFGHRLGHETDSKFYVVEFEIDDEILSGTYKIQNLDAIGDALAIDIDQLNNSSAIVTSVDSQRVKIDSH